MFIFPYSHSDKGGSPRTDLCTPAKEFYQIIRYRIEGLFHGQHTNKWGQLLMKSSIVCFYILIAFMSSNAIASEPVQIQLTDGSMISGKIISFREGVYTLQSGSLGTMKIDESQIKLIQMDSHGTASWQPDNASNGSVDNTIQTLQQSMTQNPQIMEMIQTLQNDPEIQSLIQDKDIMEAVTAGDINTLMSDPEFIKIFENPSIQQIQKEVGK